ncbi:MAG: NapC/NirT family cytochrome c [Candidatus Krumholzibacteriia bacterium]
MKRFQLFIRGVATNWIGTAGVALTTSAFVLFVFFELMHVAGLVTNAYVGMISYMALPALFILGLILVPVGWAIYRRRVGRPTSELLTQRFPDDMTRAKRLGSSLVGMIALLTVVNILFLGVGGARMLHFMDTPRFCGTACHPIMEPEWTAYQNSPHASVRCVDCHVGEGAGALVNAKLNGLWQVISATFDLYEKPVPTPVHQLRPARETCEKCHWPEKFYGDRIKTVAHFARDERNTPSFTTLALKVGSGSGKEEGTIHWHVAAANEVRYRTADDKRLVMDWVEVRRGDTFHRFTNRNPPPLPEPEGGHPLEPRSMDCVDCHNRATHIFRDPEAALDLALATGDIDTTLPFAKKIGLQALLGDYPDKQAALAGLDLSVRGSYRRMAGREKLATDPRTDRLVAALQDIFADNIFFPMNVGWNPYPDHLGHLGQGGCFRCHNPDLVDENGESIAYDCTLCHSILAMDAPSRFQYLLPVAEKDPDRKLHHYLQQEFLGLVP